MSSIQDRPSFPTNNSAISSTLSPSQQPDSPMVKALADYKSNTETSGARTCPQGSSPSLREWTFAPNQGWTVTPNESFTVPSKMDDFDDKFRRTLDGIVDKIKNVCVENIHSIAVKVNSSSYKGFEYQERNAVADYLISKGINKDLIFPASNYSRHEQESVSIALIFKGPPLPDLPGELKIEKLTP